MISRIRHALRERAIRRANDRCCAIAMAIGTAYLRRDQAAARYFEAELLKARARRDALARPVLQPVHSHPRRPAWGAVLLATTVLCCGVFFLLKGTP